MSKIADFDFSSFGGKFKAIPFINNLSVLYTLDYNTRRNDAFKKSVSCRVTDCQEQNNSKSNNPPINEGQKFWIETFFSLVKVICLKKQILTFPVLAGNSKPFLSLITCQSSIP